MATLILDRNKLRHNFLTLEEIFSHRRAEWSIVTKMLCGNTDLLEELFKNEVRQVCDSRIANLQTIKELRPDLETFYIKPPASWQIEEVVKYADYSFNTEERTIKMLSDEALKQKKKHKILISLELGELREGVMGEEIIGFYRRVFEMEGIEVVGLAANLSCLYGVLPSTDKLNQLALYAQLIEATFQKKLTYISGGSSVTVPMLLNGTLPQRINHFRIGETLYFGTNVYTGELLPDMEHDVFTLYVNLLEVSEKPMTPTGEFGTNLEGKTFEVDRTLIGKRSIRGIVDIGILDVDIEQIEFMDSQIKVAGATSDMIVLDFGENRKGYKAGDYLGVKLNYMSTLKLINSQYVEKKVVG